MAERETTAWNVVKALQPPENKGRRVFDGCLMGGGFASCLLPQKSLDNMTPNQAGFVKMNFVNRTSHSGLPPFGFVNGLLLVVIELKKPGVRRARTSTRCAGSTLTPSPSPLPMFPHSSPLITLPTFPCTPHPACGQFTRSEPSRHRPWPGGDIPQNNPVSIVKARRFTHERSHHGAALRAEMGAIADEQLGPGLPLVIQEAREERDET